MSLSFDELYLPLAFGGDARRGAQGELGTVPFGLAKREWNLADTPDQGIAFEFDWTNDAGQWNVDFSSFRTDALPAGFTLKGSGLGVPQLGSAARDRNGEVMALSIVFAMMFRWTHTGAVGQMEIVPAAVTATGATAWDHGPLLAGDGIQLGPDGVEDDKTLVCEGGWPAFVADSGMAFDGVNAVAGGTATIQAVIIGKK